MQRNPENRSFVFHSIRWRIAVPYVLLILAVMALLVGYLSAFVRNAYLAHMEDQLLAEAGLVKDALAPALTQAGPMQTFDAPALHYANLLGARVTVIGPDGTVLGESHESTAQMDNHLYRAEVQQALATGQGISIRRSGTVGYEMMYAALPVRSEGQLAGFVRVALPLSELNAQIADLRRALVLAGVIAASLAALLAVLIAERTALPVRRLTQVAERMAEGDLNARLLLATGDEVGQLTRAFNDMADQLREQVTTLGEERGRLAAVLDGMAGGVIIAGSEGRVHLINPAAARLLGTAPDLALGRSVAQVMRYHQLIELWQRCREQGEEQSAALEIGRQDLFLQAIVRPFQEEGSQSYLFMLQDLTRVRRLETVRRDFISNVSHELRTPLAGLKALVDTLRDGALEDPPAAQRFLDRMDIEVDALTQMVEELLELSRIESGKMPLRLRPVPVADVVLPVVERLRPQAERAGLSVSVELPADLPAILAEQERVQRAVTNVLHNAIKFTPPGGRVEVRGYALRVPGEGAVQPENASLPADPLLPGDWVLIAVQDTGVGIPAGDLPRIFERFYKADRARSGGGTGLGLAIAKHIIQAHGGRIWAESTEGEGSTFYFALPTAGA
jgi:two-component system phosphate regulon sensor histidine kinase PhoR